MRRLSSLLLPHSASLPGLMREAERAALTAGLEGTLYMTDFTRRAAHLQRRCDTLLPTAPSAAAGGGAAAGARRLQQRREAQRFLDAEVPKQDVNAWLEQGGNAIALCQVLQRFDLRPDTTLSALLVNKLVRTAEDGAVAALPRLQAMCALTALRPEENYERAFSVVEAVLKSTAAASDEQEEGGHGEAKEEGGNKVDETSRASPAPTTTTTTTALLMWQVYELAACVLQRCGKRVPTLLAERLVQAVRQALQKGAPQNCPSVSGPALLQLYEWMVQSELSEAGHVLYALMQQVDHLSSALFARLMRACKAHHMQRALPVQLIVALARSALGYAARASCGEVAAVLGVMRDLVRSLASGRSEMTAADMDTVTDWFHALLAEYQDRVVHFMRGNDETEKGTAAAHAQVEQPQRQPHGEEDIVTLASAYLLSQGGCGGGVLRYRDVARAFVHCIGPYVESATAPALLTTAHVLQRIQLLSLSPSAEEREMGKAYGEVLGALHARLAQLVPSLDTTQLASLAAIALTLPLPPQADASQPPAALPRWVAEARARAAQLASEADKGAAAAGTLTQLQLALAFLGSETPQAVGTQCGELALAELLPLLPLALGSPPLSTPVLNALLTRLASPAERVGVDELRWMLCMGNAMLSGAVNAYLYQHLMQPVWSSNTVSYLALLPAGQAASGPGCDVQKALSAVTSAALTPKLTVSYIAMLCAVYGDTNEALAGFAQRTGARLLQPNVASVQTVVRFLAAVRGHATLQPDAHWLSVFVEEMSPQLPALQPAQIESLLVSMHTIYADIRHTPALQMLLWELVGHHAACGGSSGSKEAMESHAGSEEQRARIVVLLVYLQQGLSLPLLTRTTPWVQQVLQHEASYAQEVRSALQGMPLPGGEADEGNAQGDEPARFTLAVPDEAHGTASSAAAAAAAAADSEEATQGEQANSDTQDAAAKEEDGGEATHHGEEHEAEQQGAQANAAAAAAAQHNAESAAAEEHAADKRASGAAHEAHANIAASHAGQPAEHSEEEATQAAGSEQTSSSSNNNNNSTPDEHKSSAESDDGNTQAAAAAAAQATAPNTYYSSFFNRSVGHIFAGKGATRTAAAAAATNNAEKEEGSSSPAASAHESNATQAQQATTNNNNSNSNTSTGAAQAMPSAPLVHPWAATSAPPTFATEASHLGTIWGIPSALQAMPAAEPSPAPPSMTGVPLAQPLGMGAAPGAASLYGVQSATQAPTAFGGLFQQQQQQQQQTPMPGFGLRQEAASNVFGAGLAAAPSFGSLFPPSPTPAAAQPASASTSTTPPQQHQQQHQQQQPSAAAQVQTPLVHPASKPATVTRTPMVGGNNIFFNPTANATTRPVVTRKAVMTRLGGRFAEEGGNAGATSSSPTFSGGNNMSSFAASGGAAPVYGRPTSGQYAASAQALGGSSGSSHGHGGYAGGSNSNNNNSMAAAATSSSSPLSSSSSAHTPGSATTAGTTFMQQAGLRRITGYNMNHIVDERNNNSNNNSSNHDEGSSSSHGSGAMSGRTMNNSPAMATASSAPLAWQEAARAVSRISRHGKTNNNKTRSQQSLSDWLSTPTQQAAANAARREANEPPTSAAPASHAAYQSGARGAVRPATHSPTRGRPRRQVGRPHEEAAAREHASPGRGRGGRKSGAASSAAQHHHNSNNNNSSSSSNTSTGNPVGRPAGRKNNNSSSNSGTSSSSGAAAAGKRNAAHGHHHHGNHHNNSNSHGPGARKSAKKTVKETAKRAAPARKAPAHKPKHGKKR